jgi:hypothetical protein
MNATAHLDHTSARTGTDSRSSTASARPGTAAWTAERIRALGTVTTVPIAAAIFGLSRSVAYELARADQFPVPVLRFGSRYRVPVAAILTALQLPVEPDPPTPRPATGPPT